METLKSRRTILIMLILFTFISGAFVWWNYDAGAQEPFPTPNPNLCDGLGEMQLLGADGTVPLFMVDSATGEIFKPNELTTGTLVTVKRCESINGETFALITEPKTGVTGWVGYATLVPVTGRAHPFVSVTFAGGTADGPTEEWSQFVSAQAPVIWMRVDASNLTAADVFQYRVIGPDGQASFGNRYTQGQLVDGSVLIELPIEKIRTIGTEGTWQIEFFVNDQPAGKVGFRVR